jgi:hypothetical protein
LIRHYGVFAQQLIRDFRIPQTVEKIDEALLRRVPRQQPFQAGYVQLQHHDASGHLKQRLEKIGRERFLDHRRIEGKAPTRTGQISETPPEAVTCPLHERRESHKTIAETVIEWLLRKRKERGKRYFGFERRGGDH